MKAAQEGDEKAYRELLNALYPLTLAFCRKKIEYLGVTEDCVQEILMTVHRVRHTYDPNLPFRPWFYTIAGNKLIDVVRKKTRLRQKELQDSELVEAIAQTPPTQTATQDSELSESLKLALSSLAKPYREVLELHKIEGHSVQEVSKKLDISVSAVKTRASRAYQMLRKKLEAMTKEELNEISR